MKLSNLILVIKLIHRRFIEYYLFLHCINGLCQTQPHKMQNCLNTLWKYFLSLHNGCDVECGSANTHLIMSDDPRSVSCGCIRWIQKGILRDSALYYVSWASIVSPLDIITLDKTQHSQKEKKDRSFILLLLLIVFLSKAISCLPIGMLSS